MSRIGIAAVLAMACVLFLTGRSPVMAQGSGAPGSSTAWIKTEQAAERQGRVVLYLSIAGVEARLKAAFRKAYPKLEFDVIRQPTGQLIGRLDAERQASASGADVVFHTDRGWFDQVASHLVPATGPALDLYKGTKNAYAENRYFTSMLVPFSIAYNTQVLASLGVGAPTGWQDMLNPKFANGLVGLPERGSAPVTLQCLHAIAQTHGMGHFERLGKLKPRLYPSIGPTVQSVAAGANAVGMVQTAAPADLIKAGAPIKQMVPTNPSCYYGYFIAQVAWSKRPEAAQVLLNWMMSRAGQEAIHGWGYTASPLANIPGGLEVKPDVLLLDGILTPAQQEFGRQLDKLLAG